MKLIINNKLTNKLKDIELIGVCRAEGTIHSVYKTDDHKDITSDIIELVVLGLINSKSKEVSYLGNKYKISLESL